MEKGIQIRKKRQWQSKLVRTSRARSPDDAVDPNDSHNSTGTLCIRHGRKMIWQDRGRAHQVELRIRQGAFPRVAGAHILLLSKLNFHNGPACLNLSDGLTRKSQLDARARWIRDFIDNQRIRWEFVLRKDWFAWNCRQTFVFFWDVSYTGTIFATKEDLSLSILPRASRYVAIDMGAVLEACYHRLGKSNLDSIPRSSTPSIVLVSFSPHRGLIKGQAVIYSGIASIVWKKAT